MELTNQNKTILVIDDFECILEITKSFLEFEGYNVVCFKNGQELLDYIKYNQNITAIIVDLVIPNGMGAEELIKRIDPSIPTFVTSGYGPGNKIMENPTKYGFKDSIFKPCRRLDLIDMLKKYIP